jgi:F-type H+-transporting ATPase subunit b
MLTLLVATQQAKTSLLSDPNLWKVINFLVFIGILIYILRNKVQLGKLFDARAAAIAKDLEQARRQLSEAEQQLAQIRERLAGLEAEQAQILAQSEREAEREAQLIREAARADAEKIRQAARREIEGALKEARAELAAFVAEESVKLAESIIKSQLRAEDHSRIIRDYAERLREVG